MFCHAMSAILQGGQNDSGDKDVMFRPVDMETRVRPYRPHQSDGIALRTLQTDAPDDVHSIRTMAIIANKMPVGATATRSQDPFAIMTLKILIIFEVDQIRAADHASGRMLFICRQKFFLLTFLGNRRR
jgi:hypothetical protein